MAEIVGKLVRISGPMIAAEGTTGVGMGEMVRVGKLGLLGEVIRIDGDVAYAQVYEDTAGMYLGEPVHALGAPLSIELGPGLLGQTYDGIQRPLIDLQRQAGDFISRGLTSDPLDYKKKWAWTPVAQVGQDVIGGDMLGWVPETAHLKHHVMVPPNVKGKIKEIKPAGEYNVKEVIARLDNG